MKTEDEYYEDGMRLCEHGQCAEALPVLDDALLQYPASPKLLTGKGSILSALGRYDEALSAYEKGIELRPDDVIGHINRGSVLCELGRCEEALSSFSRTVELALGKKSGLLVQRDNHGQPDVSHALLKRVKVDPIVADAYNFMGIAFHELGRLDEALNAFDRALSLEKALTDTYYNFAEIYYNKGNTLTRLGKNDKAAVAFVEALKRYNKAVEEYPDDALAYLDKGAALDGLGRHDEALEAYKKARSLDPDLDIPELA